MDPVAALALILSALAERDTESAREAFEDLAAWVDRGGFLPPAYPATALALAAVQEAESAVRAFMADRTGGNSARALAALAAAVKAAAVLTQPATQPKES